MSGFLSHFSRRKFITFLGAVPLVKEWKELLGGRQAPRSADPDWKLKFLAVELLRLVNTAEHRHFSLTGTHVPLKELPQSEGFKTVFSSDVMKKRFRGILDRLTDDNRFDLPGLKVSAETNGDGTKYTALASGSGTQNDFAFATDETGIIYRAIPLTLKWNDIFRFATCFPTAWH